jgi:hypothetical protein
MSMKRLIARLEEAKRWQTPLEVTPRFRELQGAVDSVGWRGHKEGKEIIDGLRTLHNDKKASDDVLDKYVKQAIDSLAKVPKPKGYR